MVWFCSEVKYEKPNSLQQLDRSAYFVFSCYNKNKNYQMSYPLCYYSNRPASGGPPPSQQMSGRQSPWRICCLEIPRKSVFQSPHRYQTSGLYCESVKHYCQQSALLQGHYTEYDYLPDIMWLAQTYVL